MMMLIIFLITDISMVGIFAGVYGNIAKYREGMLMGVHIPKSELEHPDIKELLQLYKKRNRQFYLWNMLAGIAVCLLCFTYFSIFITVWTLWLVEFCLLTILRVYHYHQKVYDIKQKNGWISSANADVSAAVDTRTSSQIAKKILPAKLHLIPAAVILIPLFFPQIRTYLLNESDGRIMFLCTILVSTAYMGVGYFFAHMPNKIYSENSQINLQINALEKAFIHRIPFPLQHLQYRRLSRDHPGYCIQQLDWRSWNGNLHFPRTDTNCHHIDRVFLAT